MFAKERRAAEIKFLATPAVGEAVREWARQHMSADPHGAGAYGDSYHTSSLYFDTPALDTFFQRRSFARSKYRIRRYDESASIFLERKQKRDGLVSKRRAAVPLDQMQRVTGAQSGTEWDGLWFAERLALRRLQPVCQITYRRTARVHTSDYGTLRLTVDDSIAASESDRAAFVNAAATQILEDRVIIELKYPGAIPAMFRTLIEELTLVERPVSKYRTAVVALGFADLLEAECPSF